MDENIEVYDARVGSYSAIRFVIANAQLVVTKMENIPEHRKTGADILVQREAKRIIELAQSALKALAGYEPDPAYFER